MEILEYFDEKNEKILGEAERDYIHEKNLWHREVAVWIMNEANEVLLQRRSPNKKQGANRLSIVAGHIDAGEKEIIGALRELEEEVGIAAKEEDLIFLGIYRNEQENNNCFSYTYLLKTNRKIEELVMQEEEVSELKYITIEELEAKIERRDDDMSLTKKPFAKEIVEKLKKEI